MNFAILSRNSDLAVHTHHVIVADWCDLWMFSPNWCLASLTDEFLLGNVTAECDTSTGKRKVKERRGERWNKEAL